MNNEQTKYVAYYRVSTKKQGASGLGLDAQKKAVNDFIKDSTLLMEFTEIESGKNNNRVELLKAIEYANSQDAILIVAKLDRLSRNIAFLMTLRDSKVNFKCCDLPDANTLTIGIFATIAQHEREITSQRTKSALQAKKAHGFKLGSPQNLTDHSRELSLISKKNNAISNENNKKAFALIKSERKNNTPYNQIAKSLNASGFRTRRNKEFTHIQVMRLEKLFASAS